MTVAQAHLLVIHVHQDIIIKEEFAQNVMADAQLAIGLSHALVVHQLTL